MKNKLLQTVCDHFCHPRNLFSRIFDHFYAYPYRNISSFALAHISCIFKQPELEISAVKLFLIYAFSALDTRFKVNSVSFSHDFHVFHVLYTPVPTHKNILKTP